MYTGCPTTYQTRQFFNNFTTNEDVMLIKISNLMQQYADIYSLYKFRVSQHPSSGVLKTVSATSGIGHDAGTANCYTRWLRLFYTVSF
jgi:hypothetical protein